MEPTRLVTARFRRVGLQGKGCHVSRRLLGLIIAGVGIVVTVVALLADPLGIGSSDDFGWKQVLGVVVGIALVTWGFVVASADEKPGPD